MIDRAVIREALRRWNRISCKKVIEQTAATWRGWAARFRHRGDDVTICAAVKAARAKPWTAGEDRLDYSGYAHKARTTYVRGHSLMRDSSYR
jgi:hypothetical protein